MRPSRSLLALLLALTVLLSGCLGASGGEDDTPAGDGTDDDGTPGDDTGDTGDTGDGGDDDAGVEPPAPVTLNVKTTGQYPANPGYDPASLSVVAGQEVTVVFENADAAPLAPHDWVVDGVPGAATETIRPGETTEVTFTAPEPGEYAFYCSVGDHRSRGMEGTFTVTAS